MSERRPNIVLLIVDTLREDRLGIAGYRPAVTPNLDRLAAGGIHATNHFANGCVTQVAFPPMFTSSLPFDFGGYNGGIRGRPVSFPEVLRDAGYETWAVVTGHPCSSHFGYDRGFDTFVDLIDLYQWFRSIFKTMLRELFERWQAGAFGDGEMFRRLEEIYDSCLADTERFINRLEALNVPESGRPRRALLEAVRIERDLLRRSPRAICEKLIRLDQDYQFALGAAEVTPALEARLARRNALRARLNRHIMLRSDRRAFGAHIVNDLFADYLAKRKGDRPFFAFLHFFDLHEAKLLLSHWTGAKVAALPRALRHALGGRSAGQRGLLYDLTLAIVDAQVGRFLALLRTHGVAENTIVVVTGDHGAVAGAPARPFESDMSRAFHDEFIHVPLILHGPDIPPQRVTGLASHLDLAPTILDAAGLRVPSAFLGAPIARRQDEPIPFAVSENAGNGRCDLAEKPLFFGLRGARCKAVFEARDFRAHEREVYDLAEDPRELVNLADGTVFPQERALYRRFVQDRLDGLRRALNDEGQTARAASTR